MATPVILIPQVKEPDRTITTLYAMYLELDVIPRMGEYFGLHNIVYEVHAVKHILNAEDLSVKFISTEKVEGPCIEVYLRKM